jgi:hypothetical protein
MQWNLRMELSDQRIIVSPLFSSFFRFYCFIVLFLSPLCYVKFLFSNYVIERFRAKVKLKDDL